MYYLIAKKRALEETKRNWTHLYIVYPIPFPFSYLCINYGVDQVPLFASHGGKETGVTECAIQLYRQLPSAGPLLSVPVTQMT